MSTKRNNPETIAIHGGDYRSDPTTNAVAVPIYRTTSYLSIALNMQQIFLP